jgi:2-octaprenyl-6-methoxyphenol hydroxylase
MSVYSHSADIVVVGGGPSGCSMAAILAIAGVKVICLDADNPEKTLDEGFDGRTIAISYGSRRVLEAAGIWDSLESQACPIEDIKILESGSSTLLEFLCQDVEAEAFGWIVEIRHLRKALYDRLTELKHAIHYAPACVRDYNVDGKGVDIFLANGEVLRASLVIGADGRKSFTRDWMGIETRGWSYDQRGIVCIVEHDNPHNNIAVEDFRPEGPFAILPMTDDHEGRHRSSIVWTEHGSNRSSSINWDDETFAAALTERFPALYGAVRPVSKRFSYPLNLIHAHDYIGERMALIADAAHGIHPIAGQGLNLGLRDVAALAELLIQAKNAGADIGSMDILKNYQRQRRLDNMAMAGATDLLNKLFSNKVTPLRLARRAGLRMVQKSTIAKRFFMKQAMGTSGLLPTLIRDGKF